MSWPSAPLQRYLFLVAATRRQPPPSPPPRRCRSSPSASRPSAACPHERHGYQVKGEPARVCLLRFDWYGDRPPD